MAGGEGSRLRPLTCDTPKPMTRLCAKPMLEYILDLLSENSFNSANITLGYLPDVIIEHFDEEYYNGIKLNFFTEDKPLGTAGSVKNASADINDTFLVISGDCLCDFDLRKAVEHHKKSGAKITILAKEVDDPREYGLIDVLDGYVANFIEKPSWNRVSTNIANTGIYIIEPEILTLIPDGCSFDFANDLFPAVMSRGMKISVYLPKGYWCDIGDLKTFLKSQEDILNGNVFTDLDFTSDEVRFLGDKPKGNYEIKPPCLIGSRVKIGDNTVIGPNCVIEDGAIIGSNCKIKSSLIHEKAIIGDGTHINDSIICTGANIEPKCSLYEGATVGAKCHIGKNSQIYSEVCIWPEKTVGENSIIYENLKFGNPKTELFDDYGISGDAGTDISPEFCARLGAAIGSLKGVTKIGIGCEHGNASKTFKAALSAGIISTGAQVWDFGELLFSQMGFASVFCGLPLCVYVTDGPNIKIRLINDAGLETGRKTEREIINSVKRGEFIRCNWSAYKDCADLSGIKLLYQQEIYKIAPHTLRGFAITPECNNFEGRSLMVDIFSKLGCKLNKGPIFRLSDDGTALSITLENGRTFSPEQISLASCLCHFKKGKDVYIPSNFAGIIDEFATNYGCNAHRFSNDNSDISKGDIRDNYKFRDGLQTAVFLMSYCAENDMTLDKLLYEVPEFHTVKREIIINSAPSEIMKRLKSVYSFSKDNRISFDNNGGYIRIQPDKKGRLIRLFAEAASNETAKSLCDEVQDKIVGSIDKTR